MMKRSFNALIWLMVFSLLIPLALAEGPSVVTTPEVTTHLRTNIDVVRRFVDREIRLDEQQGAVFFA